MKKDVLFHQNRNDLYSKVINHFLLKTNFIKISGRILKDEQTLKEYNITDEGTVHLVKGKTAAAAGGSAAAG